MPATMMHLCAGRLLCPEGQDSFLLGCILPDCVDADRTRKDHLHFRDVPPEERLQSLVAFGTRLNLSRPFDFGVLFHFYLDYLWDNGPQKAHRTSYEGEQWFLDYRKELSRAGSRTAQRVSWNEEVWKRLARATPEDWENSLDLPEEDIRKFLAFNVRWHTEERLPESEVFTDGVVDSFLKRACRAYGQFLADFFPNVLILWRTRADGLNV